MKKAFPGKNIFKTVTACALAVLIMVGVIWVGHIHRSTSILSPVTPVEKPVNVTVSAPPTTYHDVYVALRSIAENQRAVMYDGGGLFNEPMKDAAPTAAAESFANTAADTAAGETGSYGKTNIQVEGVDEADIVKNDGQYLYILSEYAGENQSFLLSIVDIASMTLVSQTKLSTDSANYRELYICGQRLVLLGESYQPLDGAKRAQAYTDEAYGFGGSSTLVKIYDISDKAAPKMAREFSHDGNYVSSRLVGSMLYLVSTHYSYCDIDVLKEESVEALVPHSKDSSYLNSKPVPADCITICKDPGNAFTVVSGLDVSSDAPASTKTVMGANGCIVYSTPSCLYTASSYNTNTEIMRFRLSGGQVTPDGKTEVPGYVKDQFALDENNGCLRIATTSYVEEQSSSTEEIATDIAVDVIGRSDGNVNNLYILDENLKITGRLEGLAKGETIQSVRYMGDTAYVVTFRQTDPLFAIDLSDPNSPTVLGQLKIPGFSSYLHPIDETTLLGIGFDADEESGGTTGLKLSLFDVSNPANPLETHKLIISGDCSSEAAYNHKAVTYIDDKKLLALPVEVFGRASVDGKQFSAQGGAGVFVIEVDKAQGFTFRKALADPQIQKSSGNGWWDNSYDRSVKRTTYLNDTLLTVSNRSVISYDMNVFQLGKQLDLYS